MRARLWPVLLAVVALLAAQAVKADPVGRYLYLSPTGGFTTFDSNLRWLTGHHLSDKPYVGARLGYQLTPLWALELAAGVTPTAEDTTGGASVSFSHASANFVVTPWSTRIGGPYFFVGGGAGSLSESGTSSGGVDLSGIHFHQGLLEGGSGLRLWLSDAVGLRVEAREARWLNKNPGQPSVNYFTLSAGVTFALGAKGRDTDGDGVPDSRDRQADTPRGAKVDQFGVAIDEDADGVPNGIDRQDNTPKGALVDQYGVAIDSDHDTVPDGIDQCPDTPVGCVVDTKGCSVDSDNDGVCDGLDKCPNSPRGCSVDKDGCPIDTDKDGVCDSLDKCPDTPAGTKIDSVLFRDRQGHPAARVRDHAPGRGRYAGEVPGPQDRDPGAHRFTRLGRVQPGIEPGARPGGPRLPAPELQAQGPQSGLQRLWQEPARGFPGDDGSGLPQEPPGDAQGLEPRDAAGQRESRGALAGAGGSASKAPGAITRGPLRGVRGKCPARRETGPAASAADARPSGASSPSSNPAWRPVVPRGPRPGCSGPSSPV
jgi:hypothetical protein